MILTCNLSKYVLGLIVGVVHSLHVSSLFENDRHFSHLSTLEREMTFRTEMGLYYSYFKTMVEAPDFLSGLNNLIYNDLTEYPNTINTMKRFNLYPEVALGIGYRIYNYTTSRLGIVTKTCFRIDRGEDLSPVESCEGLGEPIYFYLQGVWICSGFTTFFIFLMGYLISESKIGGLLSVLSFFFNHGECTRVQWSPPLRESFSFPIWLMQQYFVTVSLQKDSQSSSMKITLSSLVFIMTWQFAQFTLLTQLLCLYFMYVSGFIVESVFKNILKGLFTALIAATVVMFGNEMLITSFYFSALCSALIMCYGFPSSSVKSILRIPLQLVLFIISSVTFKTLLSNVLRVKDDNHIFDILRSKFSTFKNFHTLLYTCSKEFDFLGTEMPFKITLTLLLPSAVLGVCTWLYSNRHKLLARIFNTSDEVEPEAIYHILQSLPFLFMASIIMRLKLFLSPQLCILVSLLASKKLWASFGVERRDKQLIMVFILLGLMSIKGVPNVKEQRGTMGEFSNPELEQLIEWIKEDVPVTGSFAGPMPLMANLLLSTRRPVVNHPHYEDESLRARTKEIYRIYSRITVKEYLPVLKKLKIQFLVLSSSWCLNSESETGCAMTDLWDIEIPRTSASPPPLCKTLWNSSKKEMFGLTRVFKNNQYVVLKVM
nr:probable C-mannosyltransferase DPY19L1 isoform X1 [Lepeophtheirus salmonis]